MARLPLAVPPGVVRRGTEYTSKGAYYDAQHVRWYPSLGPTGGWRTKTATTLTGVPRAALIWNTNSAVSWLGVGTHSKLYVMTIAGVVSDVTPTSSYTAGRADAVASGGYGSGTYGTGVYGAPRPGNAEILDATQWTLVNPRIQTLDATSADFPLTDLPGGETVTAEVSFTIDPTETGDYYIQYKPEILDAARGIWRWGGP